MGRKRRPRPKHLGKKLKLLREYLNLSMTGMVSALEFRNVIPGNVSEYESGKREPSYPVLLRYARLGGCTVEQLVDDEIATVQFNHRGKIKEDTQEWWPLF